MAVETFDRAGMFILAIAYPGNNFWVAFHTVASPQRLEISISGKRNIAPVEEKKKGYKLYDNSYSPACFLYHHCMFHQKVLPTGSDRLFGGTEGLDKYSQQRITSKICSIADEIK